MQLNYVVKGHTALLRGNCSTLFRVSGLRQLLREALSSLALARLISNLNMLDKSMFGV